MRKQIFFLLVFLPLFLLSQAKISGGNHLDKYLVNGGSPIFVVINNSGVVNLDEYFEREKDELEKNFKDINARAVFVETNVVVLKNKDTKKLDFSDSNDTGKVIFWDGKVDSEPIIYDGFLKSTEHFSEIFGTPKASSYFTDFYKKQEDLRKIEPEKITKNSEKLSKKVVEKMLIDILFFTKRGQSNLINFDIKGLKSVKSIALGPQLKDRELEILFDRNGNATEIKMKGGRQFKIDYKNGVLSKMTIGENVTEFFFNDNKLKEVSDAVKVYELKNDFLLYKTQSFYDDFYAQGWREVSYENKKISYKENGGLNDTDYLINSEQNIFPAKIHYYSSDEDFVMEMLKDNVIRKMNVNQTKGDQALYYLNSQNQIEKFSYTKEGNDKLEEYSIKYEYEYY